MRSEARQAQIQALSQAGTAAHCCPRSGDLRRARRGRPLSTRGWGDGDEGGQGVRSQAGEFRGCSWAGKRPLQLTSQQRNQRQVFPGCSKLAGVLDLVIH